MKIESIQQEYNKRLTHFESLFNRQKKILSYISLLRLASVILAIYFIVLGVKHGINLLFVISGLMTVLFFALVSYHKNQNDKKKHLEKLMKLNQTELNCLNYEFSDLPDGKIFTNPSHPWTFDLDMFGEKSIFQYFNRTSTHTGPEKLAKLLSTPISSEKVIKDRQEVNKELREKLELRQNFIAHAQMMEDDREGYEDLLNWSKKSSFIDNYKWTRTIAIIMSVISLIVISYTILFPGGLNLILPLILINLGILSPFVAKTNKYQAQISKKHNFLKTYVLLLQIIGNESFENEHLKKMASSAKSGIVAIEKLTKTLHIFDQRLNLLVGFILNIFFLFDFHILHRLAKWTNQYSGELDNWLDVIGNIDAQFSLAGYSYNQPDHTYPIIKDTYEGLTAKDLGHPMIPSSKRVNNSIEINNEKVVLITGANMAGKSTYLRALGINMALSYAGCPVCASEFISGNYAMYSSMRTSDSLKDDESYFFAEIKRLKEIVDKMEQGEKLFILLDEVLKGTNTTDKQKGSKGLILKSIKQNVLCFIATHDLALGALQEEHPGQVVNYCFESYIKDLELTFDYSIRPGLAQNMNASFLMKKMGIMD